MKHVLPCVVHIKYPIRGNPVSTGGCAPSPKSRGGNEPVAAELWEVA